MFADHRHFVFGKGQPAYDVLYKIVGDDRGHVPLQLPEYDQLPVLKEGENNNVLFKFSFLAKNLLIQRVNGLAAMPATTMK